MNEFRDYLARVNWNVPTPISELNRDIAGAGGNLSLAIRKPG
jgi:hypothetical protein